MPKVNRPRLAVLRPADLTPEQRSLRDAIAGGPRATGPQPFALTDAEGGLNGPFNAMLYAPRLGQALQELGAAVRYQTSLSDRVREMAILAVATGWDCDFERYAHEPLARRAGLDAPDVAALRRGEDPAGLDPTEQAALTVAWSLVRRADLADGEYEAARDQLDEAVLVELSTLVGYYSLLALQLRLFRVGVPDDPEPA